MILVCLNHKKNIYFELLRGQGCVESKNHEYRETCPY